MGLSPGTPTVESPDLNEVGGNFSQMLSTLIGASPQQFQAQATYQPQYTNLATSNLGTAAGGVLDQYLSTIIPGLQTASGMTAGGNAGTIAGAGAPTAAAVGSISPGAMGLNNLLLSGATTELQAGSQLPAGQLEQTLNAVNTNWANRGLGQSPGNQLSDALNLYAGGQQQLSTAQGAAGNAINTNFNTVTDPTLGILNPALLTPQQTASFTGGANAISSTAAGGPTMFNNDTSASLLNMLYNGQASTNIAQANVQEAQNQAEGEFWSGLLGGAMGGGM